MDVAASEFWLESDKVERPLEYPHLLTDLNPDSNPHLARHRAAQLLELGRNPPARMGGAAAATWGCSMGLQPQLHGVAAAATWGCRRRYMGLQAPLHGLQAV